MLRILAAVAAFTVCAGPAAAQPTMSPTTTAAEPGSHPAAADIEAGTTWLGFGNSKFSVGVDCARIASVKQGLQAEANAFQRLSKGFEKFGHALTIFTATAQAAQGKYIDAAQTMGEAAFDNAVCVAIRQWGPHGVAGCAAWTAGRTAGGIIKKFKWPDDPQHRTIEEFVLDAQVEFMLPYLDQPMNAENMKAAFAAFQSKQADLKRRQQQAAQVGGQCKVEQAKSAVEDILANAKAKAAVPLTTSMDSGLSAQTDAAINQGRASADGAIAAGNSQIMSTMQSIQQDAIQQQAMQQQALQSSSSTSTPKPPKQCIEWGEMYNDLAGSQGYETVCVKWAD